MGDVSSTHVEINAYKMVDGRPEGRIIIGK
jgi:hypothetical protein